MPQKLAPGMLALLEAHAARAREEQEARVASLYAGLSPREQELVREAAVAGYIAGVRATGSWDHHVPGDRSILQETLTLCTENPDLYPTVAAYQPPEESDAPPTE